MNAKISSELAASGLNIFAHRPAHGCADAQTLKMLPEIFGHANTDRPKPELPHGIERDQIHLAFKAPK